MEPAKESVVQNTKEFVPGAPHGFEDDLNSVDDDEVLDPYSNELHMSPKVLRNGKVNVASVSSPSQKKQKNKGKNSNKSK